MSLCTSYYKEDGSLDLTISSDIKFTSAHTVYECRSLKCACKITYTQKHVKCFFLVLLLYSKLPALKWNIFVTKDTAKSTQNSGSKKPDINIDSCTGWNPWSSFRCMEMRCENGTCNCRIFVAHHQSQTALDPLGEDVSTGCR